MNAIKGYKTLIVAALVALSGFLSSPEMTAWAAAHSETVTVVLGLIMAGLRFITSSPVMKEK